MTKLHELLAVESSLEGQADKVMNDSINSFQKKGHLFTEKRTVFTPKSEGTGAPEVESQSDIQTTVPKELNLLKTYLAKSIDASYQVALANTQAKADVLDEDGKLIATGVPATALLELEKRLARVQQLIESAPTLDPAKGFTVDVNRGGDIYVAREVKKNRTRKEKTVIILHPPTKEHPAQTQLIDSDVITGTIQEQEWSSALTPARKSELLNKVEVLSRAVKQARIRANEQAVDVNAKIGNALLDQIFG